MTNKEKAIVMVYTGVCMLNGGEFQHFHKYVEELLGRPVFTHELADKAVCDEIKEKAKPDFLKLCAESKCMDLPKVSFHGASEPGQEMSETVHEVVAEMEYKFEIDAIIALLRKLLWAVQDNNIGRRTFRGVQGTLVEGVLEYIIAAMEAELEKKEKEDENENDNA